MVEVQLQLVAGGGDGLTARELQNLDQVLVGHLRELAALIRVEVDVVNIQRARDEAGVANARLDRRRRRRLRGVRPAEVREVVELEVDADLVVLERDERERQARVAAEPELQRYIQRVLRGAVENLVGGVRLATRAVVVARLAALDQQIRELRDVANHLGIASLLTRLLRELIPDVQPLAIVLVDALAADLELDPVDEVVADPVEPAELGA